MRLAEDRNDGLEMVVAQDDLIFVGARFLWDEFEDQLLALANLEDSLVFAEVKACRCLDLPLGGLLAHIPDHDWLLRDVFHGYLAEIKNVREVKHGSAADGPDGHDELLSLSEHHEVVRVVGLGLWRELDEERDLHAWGHAAGHVVDIGGLTEFFACRFHRARRLVRLFARLDLEELRVWRHDLHGPSDLVLVPIRSIRGQKKFKFKSKADDHSKWSLTYLNLRTCSFTWSGS